MGKRVQRARMKNQRLNAMVESFLTEDLDGLMASLARLASQAFDKLALLQLHDYDHFCAHVMEADTRSTIYFIDHICSSCAASSLPLQRLNPISFTKLQVGKVHHGRVVYGTLCAKVFRPGRIMTLLEDDNGLAVRLLIYNTAAPTMADIKKLYPMGACPHYGGHQEALSHGLMGARVAVKEPYFMRAADGSILIRVDDPANVHKLVTEEGRPTKMLLHVNVEELRKKGNRCFREQNWDGAAELYTKCIDATLLQLKEGLLNGNNDINTGLLHVYSNRAETWLQMEEFKWALDDSDGALRIDPGHLKSLYRKGRALLGLKHYAAACEVLEKADRVSHGHSQIKDVFGQAKILYAQNRDGKYDISDYLLGRCSSPPEVADFIGPVEIKTTKDGRGRGLYATEDIATGQLLLVSNAVAVVYEDGQSVLPTVFNWPNHRAETSMASQENLVAAVVRAARKSERLLGQLYSLEVSSPTDRLDVPAIDLFRTEDQIYRGKEKEIFEVDVIRIRDVISRNSIGGVSKFERYEARLSPEGRKSFSGLWLLPSFINHSCLPKSSRLEVGSAMFVHASKPIQKGEEITISYFDSLVPLPQRQAKCACWGFSCECKRCRLEQSLRPVLESITAQLENLYCKALVETNYAARSSEVQPFVADLPACTKFAKLFVQADGIIRSSTDLKSEEENKWIRASFVSAYFAGTQSNVFFPTVLEDGVPSRQEIMEAIQNTVPGDIRSLIMVAQHLKEAKRWMKQEDQASIIRNVSEQAREACIRVFGRHSEDVFEELVFHHSNCRMF